MPASEVGGILASLLCSVIWSDFYSITPDMAPQMKGWRQEVQVATCATKRQYWQPESKCMVYVSTRLIDVQDQPLGAWQIAGQGPCHPPDTSPVPPQPETVDCEHPKNEAQQIQCGGLF